MGTQTTSAETPDVVRLLNTLLETCTDAEKGYGAAAADASAPALKTLFRDYETQRADFVGELTSAIEKLGVFPQSHGSFKGTAHRGFIGVRRAIEGRSDAIILAECERGERSALARYDRALARVTLDALPLDVRAMVIDQRAAIKLAHDDMLRRFAGH
jgi:uncharacterized protein (TIGR02284 family)